MLQHPDLLVHLDTKVYWSRSRRLLGVRRPHRISTLSTTVYRPRGRAMPLRRNSSTGCMAMLEGSWIQSLVELKVYSGQMLVQ